LPQIAKFPTNEVQVTGQENLSFYTLDDTSSGSPKEKAFCKTCGSPVWTVPGQAKGKFVIIRTAILDSGYELVHFLSHAIDVRLLISTQQLGTQTKQRSIRQKPPNLDEPFGRRIAMGGNAEVDSLLMVDCTSRFSKLLGPVSSDGMEEVKLRLELCGDLRGEIRDIDGVWSFENHQSDCIIFGTAMSSSGSRPRSDLILRLLISDETLV
jgi:hypothetical protein